MGRAAGGSRRGRPRAVHDAVRGGVRAARARATRTARKARRRTRGSRSCRARPSSSRRRKTAPPTRGTRSRASGGRCTRRPRGSTKRSCQRYTAAETAIRERAEAKKAAAEKALRQQVQRIDQLIERAHKRAEADDLTLKEADKAARDLRTAIETPLDAAAPRARVSRRAAEGGARRARRRSCTSCARWTSGSGSPTPPSRKS